MVSREGEKGTNLVRLADINSLNELVVLGTSISNLTGFPCTILIF